jgi:hypothetical protein
MMQRCVPIVTCYIDSQSREFFERWMMDASESNRSIIDEAPTSSVCLALGPDNEGL